jgi:hypothetical protein
MAINPSRNNRGITIANVEKQYDADGKFMKYLKIPMDAKRICKKKYVESKIQRALEELDKVEYSSLPLNQIMRVIKCNKLNKIYYLFAN